MSGGEGAEGRRHFCRRQEHEQPVKSLRPTPRRSRMRVAACPVLRVSLSFRRSSTSSSACALHLYPSGGARRCLSASLRGSASTSLARAAAAAARMAAAAKPTAHPHRVNGEGGGRVYEAQRLARGGAPRWPVCVWRPYAPPPPGVGIPVGAFVCEDARSVQQVRFILKSSGRLKYNGVTRFDAGVWRALIAGADLSLLDSGPDPAHPDTEPVREPSDPSEPSVPVLRDEWAVHVFGIQEGAREEAAMAALLNSGAVRYVPGVRIGSPACYVDTSSGGGGGGGAKLKPGSPVFNVGAWTPLVSASERERVMREARAEELDSRGVGQGGRVGGGAGLVPPRWAPASHDALAAAVSPAPGGSTPASAAAAAAAFAPFTFSELFAGIGGFGIALRSLGGTAVFASELCPHARRTYYIHHGGAAGRAQARFIHCPASVIYSTLRHSTRGGRLVHRLPHVSTLPNTTPLNLSGGRFILLKSYVGYRALSVGGGDGDGNGGNSGGSVEAVEAAAANGVMMVGDITDVCDAVIPPHDVLTGRGFHSSTSHLNLVHFCH